MIWIVHRPNESWMPSNTDEHHIKTWDTLNLGETHRQQHPINEASDNNTIVQLSGYCNASHTSLPDGHYRQTGWHWQAVTAPSLNQRNQRGSWVCSSWEHKFLGYRAGDDIAWTVWSLGIRTVDLSGLVLGSQAATPEWIHVSGIAGRQHCVRAQRLQSWTLPRGSPPCREKQRS